MNININSAAQKKINEMLEESGFTKKSFRIYIRRVSRWHGPIFDIALEESINDDEIFKVEDFEVILEKSLAKRINNIDILYSEGISKSGFRVNTDLVG